MGMEELLRDDVYRAGGVEGKGPEASRLLGKSQGP